MLRLCHSGGGIVTVMYIHKIEVKNLKALEHFIWTLPSTEKGPGWHVWLGDNGSGKTTLIRACAVVLAGPKDAMALRQPWDCWVRRGTQQTTMQIQLSQDEKWDYWTGSGHTPSKTSKLSVGLTIDKHGQVEVANQLKFNPNRHVWGDVLGWFAAAYGPFRRFSGGGQEYGKLFYSHPRLSRYLSAFGEDVALTEVESWLKALRFAQLEKRPEEGKLLDALRTFINQPEFLPNGLCLKEVNSQGVQFTDGMGCEVDMNELSDGFRSILSMTFELVRQMVFSYIGENIFNETNTAIIAPGVVFVDEIDVHLHPRWQRTIGPWLTKLFPKVQFFVTTHSPLICQGAVPGSVWRLADPVQDHGAPSGPITGIPLKRLLYGNLLEAMSSGAFGSGVERSDSGEKMLAEYAKLNRKSMKIRLNSNEMERKQMLQAIFGASG